VVCRWGKYNYNRLGGKRCLQVGGEPQQLEDLMQQNGKDVTTVAAGRSHTLAIAMDADAEEARVFAWGNDNVGQLGNNNQPRLAFQVPAWVIPTMPEDSHFEPQDITVYIPSSLGAVKGVFAGPDHSAALLDSGALLMWGRNNYGQCGQGHINPLSTPSKVAGTFVKVALGFDFTIAIDDLSNVWAWGDNMRGQLGTSMTELGATMSMVPFPVSFFEGHNIVNISAGSYHAFAWGARGMFVWGENDDGQIGVGNRDPVVGPVQIPFFAQQPDMIIVDACGGRYHSAVISADQRVFTWGSNEVGQLGTGPDVKCQTQPKEVTSLSGKPLEHVSCGYDSTFVW